MAQSVTIPWNEGKGSITATYEGSGNGAITLTSEANTGIDRAQEITVTTDNGAVSEKVTLSQEGLRQPFGLSGGGVFRIKGGGRFGVLKVGEPMETYTRLTYIECTGEQYINTGYVVQEDDVIEMTYISTSATSADKYLYGCSDDNGYIWFSLYSNTAYVRFGSSTSASITNARMTYKLTMEKSSAVLDSGNSATPDFVGLPQVPLYLFARNAKSTGVGMYGYCRCLGFSIKKSSGELVMDLKPCKRDSDDAVGMLDLVSGQFFGNGGTGEDLIAGAEINIAEGYEVIDYVTFDKDKLFDLGIVKSTYTLEVMFARSEKSATPYLYGCVTSPHTASVTAYLSGGGAWRFGSSYKGLSTNNTFINRTIISNGKTDFNFTAGTFTKSTFTTPDTVVLGGYRAASGSLYKNYQGKVFYIRINEGDTPIIDYYPCKRLSDGIEGFWDCVSQTFIQPM
ncbi:MAG: hypothetical protein IKK89_04705 [Alistipes sp.]|nr:hypothetical protein [Alistipes sp.]MBR6631227.1 hypothetical protein [Alistipes sp.]